jgi:tetratricopeptide (TPR) repeat protein
MKRHLLILILIVIAARSLIAQNVPVYSEIDLMLIHGDNEKVIDTCRQILKIDSLNPELYYKMGIAYQNILAADSSEISFSRAVNLDPGNKLYNFMLAKGYFTNGKYRPAEPLLTDLCSVDTLNWLYAYYLTSIYMQENKYDEAIKIYKRFVAKDSDNCIYLDKLGYAALKKGDYNYAIEQYNRSLSINEKNLTAIKNLAYLYTYTMESDTAIQLLTRGIEIDSTDMDLYISRANLYWAKKITKRALDDYTVLVSSGDSSKLYLKRIGIGYCFNLQPKVAISWLLKAYNVDSLDFETCSYLGQSYFKVKDMKNSIYFYNREIAILGPVNAQLGLTYNSNAESQKSYGRYKDAIASYLNADRINSSFMNYLYIANLYDEKLNDTPNAIIYYEKYLEMLKATKMGFSPDYIETINKRLDYLKNPPLY